MMTIESAATLNNGVAMPWLGLGVFKAEPGAEVEQAVSWALEAGYRHIDTATVYRNEESVGRAVAESGLSRDEVFVTTKLWNDEQDDPSTAIDRSLRRLGFEYVDLYLVHWPITSRIEQTWGAMEGILESGRTRAVGVSNFLIPHLDRLLAGAGVVPAVNQVEFHPRLQQPELHRHCESHGIIVEAWSPIMRGAVNGIPELVAIGEHHGKSAVQVTLRWMLQYGVITIPKSVGRERIRANADLYDFELSAAEILAIEALDRGERLGPDPMTFAVG